jgi:3'-5' exonuclease/HEAT repeats
MTANVGYDPTRWRRVHVQDVTALCEVTKELMCADAIGVDLEMGQRVERKPGGQQEWIHILALVQIASDTLSVIVDPLRCTDLSPLGPLLAGPIRKVFLGGGQDVALLEKAGIPARNIVDVGEIGLAIYGRREDGMAALSRRMFGLSLDKTVRRTDWMVRPLNPTLLSYAYRDAELTLTIYRWFTANYPDVVRAHERVLLDPPLPLGTPEWLEIAFAKQSGEAYTIAMERGLDPRSHAPRLTTDLSAALREVSAPRMVNKLVRMAADLGLEALVPAILPLIKSSSSLVRASAARALGRLASPEIGKGLLEGLKDDPIEEVRKTAGTALKEMKKRVSEPDAQPEDEPSEPVPSLDDDTRSALQRLLQQMESEAG